MSHPVAHHFRKASAEAVQNTQVIAAVRKTADILFEKRAMAVADAPDFEALRDNGRALKMEISGNLEKYAQTFAAHAQAAGAVVHRAADAAAVARIAIKIASDNRAETAVKGKSMTAEEVELNEALELSGVAVTETDLGEFIIQLANEKPSHIMAPAIHRNRAQVAELFTERIGTPPGLDVEALVAAARKYLREKFLAADMGITGGNFAIAETGSLVLVSNEGNIRMATTLPRVHLAIVGIDKVIPKMADLPQFLALLTRSASGQTISSYMSIITGPRRTGEEEGPDRLHIILLDNGRSRIAQGSYREILHCLHCGACISHCPVYRAVGGHAYQATYPGPMGAVLSPLIAGLTLYADLPNACTLCGRCAEVCPVRVPLPDYLRLLRSDVNKPALMMKLAARAAAHPLLYRFGMIVMRRLLNKGHSGMAAPALKEWMVCREPPELQEEESFREWWLARSRGPGRSGK
jgi:L-lactate dehydrogenase complex protein LldF